MSDTSTVSKSAATVTVASKMPFPIRLQLQKVTTGHEALFGGGARAVDTRVKHGQTVVIDGCARPVGVDSEKVLVGGFALTPGVNADFWNAWLKQNEEFPPVAMGLIFATGKADVAADKAKEFKSLKSGFEPVDPANPPAEFTGKSGVTVAA